MMHPVEDSAAMAEAVVVYLERLGVTGLRQPHDPARINQSALQRYLLLAMYEQAQRQPATASGHVSRSAAPGRRA